MCELGLSVRFCTNATRSVRSGNTTPCDILLMLFCRPQQLGIPNSVHFLLPNSVSAPPCGLSPREDRQHQLARGAASHRATHHLHATAPHAPHPFDIFSSPAFPPHPARSILYEHYPRPKEFIVRYGIQEVLAGLLRTHGSDADAVIQQAQRLLSAFNINVLL